MKGTRRSKVWLALGLVAMACLVLAGCPHNNLLDGGGNGGGNGADGRGGGNGAVQLVITNFTAEAPPAGRSASWLAPSRTIAPDHIDLKDPLESAKYIFVVTGSGTGGTLQPQYITLGADGSTSLDITNSGLWNIDVQAYELAALKGLVAGSGGNLVDGTDNADFMGKNTDAQKIVAHGGDALVLKGSATLNLDNSNSATVTLTLTNDGVGTKGALRVNVEFDPASKAEIDKMRYDVTVALYDFITGEVIEDGGHRRVEHHEVGNGTIANPFVFHHQDVPKGRYQFRVTVLDSGTNAAVAHWVDDIRIEGNRTTDKSITVTGLFNPPNPITDLEVYWSRPTDNTKEGFVAHVTWAGMPYNAVGLNLEIADITDWYRLDAGTTDAANLKNLGLDTLNATDDLWNIIDTLDKNNGQPLNNPTNPGYYDVVTVLSWDKTPQNAGVYPAIWRSGSLLNGSKEISFLMQTGRIYSIRATVANGTTSSIPLIVGAGTNTTATPTGAPTKFTRPENNGLFSLVKVAYDLEQKYALYQTQDGASIGTKATPEQLVTYSEYKAGDNITIDMKYATAAMGTAMDWLLYPTVVQGVAPTYDDRIKTWDGWKDTLGSATKFDLPAGPFDYGSHKDLNLIPTGAGAPLTVQGEVTDTFNVLDENTVLVEISNDGSSNDTFALLSTGHNNPGNPGNFTNIKNNGFGIKFDTDKVFISLDSTKVNKTFLHVTVGKGVTALERGVLTDKNGKDFNVKTVSVDLIRTGFLNPAKSFGPADTKTGVVGDLTDLMTGDYKLTVTMLIDRGEPLTKTFDCIVKNETHSIP